MTVDEILNQCDTALITPLFLYGKDSKVLSGTVTLTINATKSKTFTIFPKSQQDVWDWVQARAGGRYARRWTAYSQPGRFWQPGRFNGDWATFGF